MKKIIILLVIIILLLVVGIFGYIKYTNKIVSTVTLDINPSIEINLNKSNKVVNVIALNEDAKDIIGSDLKGKTLDETIKLITNNVIEKGYAEKDYVGIILYSKGNVDNEKIKEDIEKIFSDNQKITEIIVVNEVTGEDEELAKKYNISPAKVSYIKSIIDDKENISVEDFSNKPINELKDTEQTGNYCLDGYMLEGSWCLKEIGKKNSKSDKLCPNGYFEYNGKCYEEIGVIDTGNVLCPDGFVLENNECIKKNYIKASVESYTCSKGMVKTKGEVGMAPFESGPAREVVCVDTKVTKPVTVCNLPKSDPTERMSYNGKCYWHRAPVISSGCPGKTKVKGYCWDSAEGVYMCPNGYNSNKRTKDDECYTVLKNIKPTISSYKCDNEGMVLEGDKCMMIEKVDLIYERTCPGKALLINNERCINLDKSADKVDGFVCDEENTRLHGNECIIYEQTEALHN